MATQMFPQGDLTKRGQRSMACCSSCAELRGWTYELNGDGDGIEFLDEIALLHNGTYRVSTVVLSRTP